MRLPVGHGDEDLAGRSVVVHADGDVAFVSADGELVGDGAALVGEFTAHRPVDHALGHGRHGRSGGGHGSRVLLLALAGSRTERLYALGVVAIDGDGFQAQLPAFGVGGHDVLHRALFGHVDGLGNGARDERLDGGHHLDVTHVVDGAGSILRTEAAIEYRQMLRLQFGSALDSAGGIDVGDDLLHLFGRVAQFDEGGGDGIVDDLDDAAAHQLLVLDEREIGLDAGGIAIHHEADGAGGRDHGHLRVAIAALAAAFVSVVPALPGALHHGGGHAVGIDAADGIAVHADDFE